MTTYYARPNLNDTTDTTGWSRTSGGPSAGAKPGQYDTVIFDQNSGPSRTITSALTVAALVMSGNPMTFTSSVGLAGNSVLKGTFLDVYLGSYATNDSTVFSLDTTLAVITRNVNLSVFGAAYWKFTTDIAIGGDLILDGSTNDAVLYAQNINVTCRSIWVNGSSSTSNALLSLGLGGTTITVTGATRFTGGGTQAQVVTLSPSVVNASTIACTLVLTDQSSAVKQVQLGGLGVNFVNNTGNGQGAGGVQFTYAQSQTFGTYDAGKGAVNIFGSGYTYTATTWTMDGAGQANTIKASTTTAAVIAKSGGGVIAANFCNFTYINCATSPSTAIRATNSKIVTGGGTGITLVGMTSRFMPFF